MNFTSFAAVAAEAGAAFALVVSSQTRGQPRYWAGPSFRQGCLLHNPL
jgi:hypothetical protein